jgi:hypothetical protein
MTHVEAHPSNLSHGRNQRKTLQIARTKIGPKILSKIKKIKNISAHRERWFNPNPWMYWCKSRVYNVWKPAQHPPTLWRIGGISHFLSSPLLHHEAHTHILKATIARGWERDGWMLTSLLALGVLIIEKLMTKLLLLANTMKTTKLG